VIDAHQPLSGHRIRGFTLIEVVIVIAILATLASVAVAGLSSFRERARIEGVASTAASELRSAFSRDLAAETVDSAYTGTLINWAPVNVCSSINNSAINATGPIPPVLDGFYVDEPGAVSAPQGKVRGVFTTPTFLNGDVGTREGAFYDQDS